MYFALSSARYTFFIGGEIMENEELQTNEPLNTVDPGAIEDPLNTVDTEGVTEIIPEVSIFETGNGSIQVIHELSLGDLLISSLLLCILIFLIINRFIGGR